MTVDTENLGEQMLKMFIVLIFICLILGLVLHVCLELHAFYKYRIRPVVNFLINFNFYTEDGFVVGLFVIFFDLLYARELLPSVSLKTTVELKWILYLLMPVFCLFLLFVLTSFLLCFGYSIQILRNYVKKKWTNRHACSKKIKPVLEEPTFDSRSDFVGESGHILLCSPETCTYHHLDNTALFTRGKIVKLGRRVSLTDIGLNFNEWRYPTSEFGKHEKDMTKRMKQFLGIDMDIAEDIWEERTKLVDFVLDLLLAEIKEEASKYEGLRINRHIRQGSSREGLNVNSADEFDLLLQFDIEGLSFQFEPIEERLPELCYVAIENSNIIKTACPRMFNLGVFEFAVNGKAYLHSRFFFEKVFTSVIDVTISKISLSTQFIYFLTLDSYVSKRVFRIRRKTNAPSVNVSFDFNTPSGINIPKLLDELYEDKFKLNMKYSGWTTGRSCNSFTIDVDIVPAILIRYDAVPDPVACDTPMSCPVHAVFKWKTENQPFAMRHRHIPPHRIWRVCTSGYEKHVFDLANGDINQCYIITALRIMKSYFELKKNDNTPIQLATILRSYHLKHIAFYCLFYLCILERNPRLDGVHVALSYFICFLRICLEQKRLPHFFHANPTVNEMFPTYTFEHKIGYNLFEKSDDALLQALHSLKFDLWTFKRMICKFSFTEICDDDAVKRFRDFDIRGIVRVN